MEIILTDLGIGLPIVKGQDHPVRNCWHFSTDGAYAEVLFRDRTDFVDAMNRIYLLIRKYPIVILAFCLMDNHIHLILYGPFEECNRFVHELVRQISSAIARRHGLRHELRTLPIHYQTIDDDFYLKKAICYVHKNPTAANLPYQPHDYPWSSGGLFFRSWGEWTLPDQLSETAAALCGGAISRLSLPDAEMRQHKRELLKELFGRESSRELNTHERIRLGKELRRRYNSSPSQIARLVGLSLDELATYLK